MPSSTLAGKRSTSPSMAWFDASSCSLALTVIVCTCPARSTMRSSMRMVCLPLRAMESTAARPILLSAALRRLFRSALTRGRSSGMPKIWILPFRAVPAVFSRAPVYSILQRRLWRNVLAQSLPPTRSALFVCLAAPVIKRQLLVARPL